MFGRRLNEAKHCWSPVVVTCLPLNPDGSYTMFSDLGCVRRDDGVVYVGSLATFRGGRLGSGWKGCDLQEVETEFKDVAQCP